MLDHLGCPAGEGLEAGLESVILILHLNTLSRANCDWQQDAQRYQVVYLATHTHARIATAKKRKMCGDERTEILLKTGQQSLLGGQALKSVPSSFTAAAFQKMQHKWQLGTCPVPLRRCANRLTFPCMLVLRTEFFQL